MKENRLPPVSVGGLLFVLTALRRPWQNAMSGSKLCDLNTSESVSSDLRRSAFSRYTLDTYGTFHTPLQNSTHNRFPFRSRNGAFVGGRSS